MPTKSPSFVPRHALAAACAVLLAGGAWAQTVSGVNGSGVPGGTASVAFDFDFGSGLSIDGLVFSLEWDASRLTLLDAAAEYNGSPLDVAAALAASGEFTLIDNSPIGNIGAQWFAVDANFDPLPPLDLAGSGSLSLQFMLAPSFAVPGSSPVALGLLLSPRGDTPIELSAMATISAVPEPQSWALLLAGGAGIAAWARRRARA